MADLLFGIVTEEIPARMQAPALEAFQALAVRRFEEGGLAYDHLEVFVTPRRITLIVQGLPLAQQVRTEVRKGPSVTAPAAAQEGFFRSVQQTPADCFQEDTPKGPVWMARIKVGGQKTADLLPKLLEGLLSAMPWPKSMRWANSKSTWVRPIVRLCCLFDGQICPVRFDSEGLDFVAGNQALANHFLAPEAFSVTGPEDYKRKMRDGFVLLDRTERRQIIVDHVTKLAHENGLEPLEEDLAPGGLVDEVTGLVEWPLPLLGQIDDRFLGLPPEVLITPMRVHQRYFPLRNPQTKALAPFFALIAANTGTDGGQTVRRGNERVLRARLSDAQFFWTEDLKKTLADHREALKSRQLFQGLATLWDKGERLAYLARSFFPDLEGLEEVCRLSKADLATQMVGEFPELQGIMGMRYGFEEGLPKDFAEALRDQYITTPATVFGASLGILDRIDTLYGFFGAGVTPTGSKDPLALRRAAAGLIALIRSWEGLPSLECLFMEAGRAYRAQGLLVDVDSEALWSQTLWPFILERLQNILEGEQISPMILRAASASTVLSHGDLQGLVAHATSLALFLKTEKAQDFLALENRISSLLTATQKKGWTPHHQAPSPTLFQDGAETALWEAFEGLPLTLSFEDWVPLRPFVDAFFEKVTIHAENPQLKENRLSLLWALKSSLACLGNFSDLDISPSHRGERL